MAGTTAFSPTGRSRYKAAYIIASVLVGCWLRCITVLAYLFGLCFLFLLLVSYFPSFQHWHLLLPRNNLLCISPGGGGLYKQVFCSFPVTIKSSLFSQKLYRKITTRYR